MNFKTLQNGFSLPEIGLGTWTMGGAMESDYSQDEEMVVAIKNAIDMGYTHIDTAELYGAGHTDELIAQAIADVDRENLQIASKVFKTNLTYDDVIASTKASLERLQIDYIDLHYIHAPNPDISLEETIRAFDDLVAEGLIKHIGVSNFTVALMEEAQSYTKNKIVANQVEYSLAVRDHGTFEYCTGIESEILPYCQTNDVFLVAYKPIDRGTILEPNDLLDELCAKYNKTRAQIAMNWLISQDNVVTIPKSANEDRLKENHEASGWYMEQEDVGRLRSDYDHNHNTSSQQSV